MRRQWRRTTLCLLLINAMALGTSNDASNDPWKVLTMAIDSGGPQASDALSLLGTINSKEARTLLDKILNGRNSSAIEDAARGLPSNLSLHYLPKLARIAKGGSRETPFSSVLGAIRRVNSLDAARILANIGGRSSELTAAVAFGLLGQMGAVAEPVLEKEALSGPTSHVRNTVIYILRDMRTQNAIPIFRAALKDPSGDVRLAASLGLAQWGIAEGKAELEKALESKSVNDHIEPLVALAVLGQAKAFDTLRGLLSRPSSDSIDSALKVSVVWAIARLGDVKVKAFAYQMGLDKKTPEYKSMIIGRLLDPSDPKDLATMKEALANGDAISRLVAASRLLTSQLRQQAESVIAKSLDRPDVPTRNLAIQYATEDRALLPEVAGKLGTKGTDSTLTTAALMAIMKLNQKGRFKDVTQYFASQDQDVSLTAAKVLVMLDRNAAESVFKDQMQSKIDHVRIFSAAMLLALANNVAANPELILPQVTN